MNRLLHRVVDVSARHPLVVLLVAAALGAWGVYSMLHGPLDAIPDLSDPQVIVATEWPGQSPDLVEDQVTYPISSALLSAPGVRLVRGQSFFGTSLITVIFEEGTDMYWARSRIVEYLSEAQSRLPRGVTPALGPDATGVGWVFSYALLDTTGTHDLAQLRSLQDWNVRYALESVPGVAEVASIGGFVREYQVLVDPHRLAAFDLPLERVIETVGAANREEGGGTLEIAGHEHMVRARGYITELEEIETVPLGADADGNPIRVVDVADVQWGPGSRRGLAELNGWGEVAGGIVVMRYGENALQVIDRVKTRLDEVRATLPEGVEVVTTYDRSELIEESIATLRETLFEEMLVVSLIIFLFLLHVRSALVPVLTLPLAVLLAFIPMAAQNLTINIMSLGGIAVAIGAMVDASLILVENVHKRLEEWEQAGREGERRAVLIEAMQEVAPSLFFSLLVITVSFLPVFTLQATEGRLFKPLAFTKTYSMAFAALLAVTVTPALAALAIRGRVRGEAANPLNRWLPALYAPVVRMVVRFRWAVVVLAVAAVGLTVPALLSLEDEFMPPLYEGAILYMPTAPPGMSEAEASRVLQRMDAEIMKVPEVVSVFGKAGRADTATDPAPLSMFETTIVLKPRDEWRRGLTWDGLVEDLNQRLTVPGMPNIWWMPIQTRIEMLATGIRSELGIKVFGDDPARIQASAREVERVVSGIEGARTAYAERNAGGFFLDVVPRREQAARLGLTAGDITRTVQVAVGGVQVSEIVQGRERYPLTVRYARDFRDTPEALNDVLVPVRGGSGVPLSEVAEVRSVTGPSMIRSEEGRLVGFVFVDVEGRSVPSFVAEARDAVAEQARLAPGTRLEWAGQFRYYERAKERLKLVVPVTLVLVLLLLVANTRSWVQAGIVFLSIPFSLIGAVWLLWLLDYNLSVAVWVGLIALAGLDAEMGVIMLLYLTLSYGKARKQGRMSSFADLTEAIVDGAARRIRPKLMTVLTTMVGLTPLLLSTGVGSDVMKRIAAPMVGGLATSFLLELLVYPAVYAIWKSRSLKD